MSTEIQDIPKNFQNSPNGSVNHAEHNNQNEQASRCEKHLLSMIHKASRQIEVYLDNVFQNKKVSAREAHLLGYLKVYGPCSVSELIRVFGLKASTLTSMLDRMENSEYIVRKPNPDDRRSLLLHISEKGTDIAQLAFDATDEMSSEIKNRVSQEDLDGFEKIMKSIDEFTKIKLR